MIKQIYLDLDNVLCGFKKAAVEAGVLDLKTQRVDFNTLKCLGEDFWIELEWINEGKKLYDFLEPFCREHRISLCVLSSIYMTCGKEGKKKWVSNNTKINPLNVYIVNRGKDKVRFADSESVLIDDYSKNVQAFIQAGGHAYKFENDAGAIIAKIKDLVSGDDNAN